MRCRLAIPLVLLAALAAGPTSPAAARDAHTQPAWVRLVDCSAETSSAAFYARMRHVPDSDWMRMRFTLLVKQGERYVTVRAPGLSVWRKARPGVAAFGYRQAVRGLQPGALYRVRVSFRWYSADGELIESARRRSPVCRQFAALPNLAIQLLGAEPTKVRGVLRYLVRVSNTGVAPAGGVAVRLTVDGGVVDTVTLASLQPGERRELAISAPECTSAVEAAADPDGMIVETSELDNVAEVPCADLPEP
jgi:hypothetical protein